MSRKKKNKVKEGSLENTPVTYMGDGYGVVELDLDEVGIDSYGDGSVSEYEKTVREIENYKAPGKLGRFFRALIPWRGDGLKEIIRKLIFVIALGVFVFSALYIINYQVDKMRNDSLMSEVIGSVGQVDQEIDDKIKDIMDKELEDRIQQKIEELLAQGMNPDDFDVQQMVEDEIRQEVEALTLEEIIAKYPDIDFPKGISAKYAELYVKNQEMVGYISIKNTEVHFPVTQTTDNDKYLEYNFYKYKSTYGCPFVDYSNNVTNGIENFDTNTTIYGHHIRNGAMFAKLDVYKTLSGYKASPVIDFNTLTGEYKWKIVSVFITNVYTKDDNGSIFNYTSPLNTDEEFDNFVNQIKLRSMYNIDVDIQKGDKFLTLSTCSYDFDGARLVIVGRLVRDGEDAGVDTSKVTVNPEPKYPQAWYDAYGLSNPWLGVVSTKPSTTKTTTTSTTRPTTTTTVQESTEDEDDTTTTTTKKTTTKTTTKKTTTTTTKSTTQSTTESTTQSTTEQTTTTTTEPTTTTEQGTVTDPPIVDGDE